MADLKISEFKMYNDKNLTGIGGWLIFILIGLLFSPIRIFFEALELFSTVFNQEVWSLLTSPESEIYSAYWAPIITLEIILNLLMMVFTFACLFAFLKKLKIFKKLYIALLITFPTVILFDSILALLVLSFSESFDAETILSLLQLTISAIIWINYIRKSRRVQLTFVN